MKYLRQLSIILAVTFLGELLRYLLPLPVPAGIYGMVLMFISLMTGIVKTDQIKETAGFLTEIMTVMFIPSAAGLIDNLDVMRPMFLPIVLMILFSTPLVIAVTGRTAQYLIRKKGVRGDE